MLRLSIHAGVLDTRAPNNQLGALDIAYQKRAAMADYLVALVLRTQGELTPGVVSNYPRWSGSVWDLVARALTRALYKSDQAPAAAKPDRRCAYATRVCAALERMTADEKGVVLGTLEIAQLGPNRGVYTAKFTEDLLGPRTVSFEYGAKMLNPADLVLRAICWSFFGKDTLGARPKLMLPATMSVDGNQRFDIESLDEPARTGFARFEARRKPTEKPECLPLGKDYVQFLQGG